jgi:two-component system sensor histidine kinase YesM
MGFRSISVKIFAGMAGLTAFLLILMWTVNHFVYSEELRNYEVDYNVLVTNKIKSQFDFTTDLIRKTGNSLGSKEEILDLLASPPQNPEEKIKFQQEMSALLLGATEIQPFIKGVHIVSKNGSSYSSVLSVNEKYIVEFASEYIVTMEQKDSPRELWSKLHQVEYYPQTFFNVISYVSPIYNINTQKLLGLIVLDVDYDLIREMFTVSSIELNEKVMVVDPDGNIVFNYPFESSYEPVIKQYPQILTSRNLELRAPVFGKDSIIVTQTIDMADWKIVRMIETLPITKNSRYLLTFFNSIIGLSAIVCFIYIYIVTQSISKPIKTLTQACKQIEKGDRAFRVSLNVRNEMGILGDTFNIMMDQLQNYYHSEISDQKRKSDLEFQILQAQINPHFLYNTLDSIKWLAVMQNMNNIADMSTSLINLLKYNLTHPSKVTTVKSEVENLKHYIQIQKFRYGDTFEFSTQLDAETLNCTLLRFVLQPLVENCIIHGFEDIESGGFIKVLAFIDNNQLHVEVIDNGSGMDLAVVNDLNDENSSKGKRFNTIGVRNIKERIQLHFGEQYGLFYASEPGIGTIAEMVFPIIHSEGE